MKENIIMGGHCYSTCFFPQYVDSVNKVITSGKVPYDVPGVKLLFQLVNQDFQDDSALSTMVREECSPEFEAWLSMAI